MLTARGFLGVQYKEIAGINTEFIIKKLVELSIRLSCDGDQKQVRSRRFTEELSKIVEIDGNS